jgi:hypothetical protein
VGHPDVGRAAFAASGSIRGSSSTDRRAWENRLEPNAPSGLCQLHRKRRARGSGARGRGCRWKRWGCAG